jgi:hypothetical protein
MRACTAHQPDARGLLFQGAPWVLAGDPLQAAPPKSLEIGVPVACNGQGLLVVPRHDQAGLADHEVNDEAGDTHDHRSHGR